MNSPSYLIRLRTVCINNNKIMMLIILLYHTHQGLRNGRKPTGVKVIFPNFNYSSKLQVHKTHYKMHFSIIQRDVNGSKLISWSHSHSNLETVTVSLARSCIARPVAAFVHTHTNEKNATSDNHRRCDSATLFRSYRMFIARHIERCGK